MASIIRLSKKPSEISDSLFSQMVDLSHKSFKLTDELVIKLLMKRDLVDIYIDKKCNQVIGMLGIQWIEIQGNIYVYLGNAVIDEKYRSNGLVTKSVFHYMLSTKCRWPTKHIYCVFCSSSPTAFKYINKFNNSWPKVKYSTPEEMMQQMEIFSKTVFPNDYIKSKNIFYIKSIASHFGDNEFECKDQFNNLDEVKMFFEQQKHHAFPTQILMLGAVTLTNVLKLIFYTIKGLLVSLFKKK
jgi:hypothetical protein